MKSFRIIFLLFSLIMTAALNVDAQTIIRGTVLDKNNLEPLPFIGISVKGTVTGTTSDINGKFELAISQTKGNLEFSFLGYKNESIPFNGSTDTMTVLMEQTHTNIEITVTAKAKYRNKNNPAVELIRQVVAHREENRQRNTPNLAYEQYEKVKISIIDPDKEIFNNALLRKYKFMLDNLDTVSLKGKELWPIYIDERLSEKYFTESPKREKTILKAHQRIEFDERFINNDAIVTSLDYVYQDIDIYKSNIYILTRSFLSPIADLSPGFYKFFIWDTTVVNGSKIVHMNFMPRNKTDLLFTGDLYINLDNFAVTRAVMHINENTAINWINSMNIELDFEPLEDKRYYLKKNVMDVDFGLSYLKQSILASRHVTYSNYDITQAIPDSVFKGDAIESQLVNKAVSESILSSGRPSELSSSESLTYKNYDSLTSMSSFNRVLQWSSFLISGYLNLGKIEIGPSGTFISGNQAEGLKLRLAARTTSEFNKRLYLAGNIGYSFKDEKIKHYVSAAYAFNKKSVYSYPQNFLQISHVFDSRSPGADLQFQEEENPLFSIKRGINDKYIYDDILQLSYILDISKNFRMEAMAKKWIQQPFGGLHLINRENGVPVDSVSRLFSTEFGVLLRWAPNERKVIQKNTRVSFPSRYPVITARFTTAVPNVWGSDYQYQKIELKLTRRFILSQLGHADMDINAGYMFGKDIPYPYLFMPKANQSYFLWRYSYNLMNFMEFVSDKYVSINFDYHMQGFLFNKIPLLKKLRFREVANFRAIYGGIDDRNNPLVNNQLFDYPRFKDGTYSTFNFGKLPYMEVSAGIENILNFFRVDMIWRLNYLDHPNISKMGIRVGAKFAL